MTGAIIGALAGAFAVLLFRLSERKKNGGEKPGQTDGAGEKQPVRIDYKPKDKQD